MYFLHTGNMTTVCSAIYQLYENAAMSATERIAVHNAEAWETRAHVLLLQYTITVQTLHNSIFVVMYNHIISGHSFYLHNVSYPVNM